MEEEANHTFNGVILQIHHHSIDFQFISTGGRGRDERSTNILSDAVLSRASVLATVLILNVGDIDMTYHVVVHRHVLADEEA